MKDKIILIILCLFFWRKFNGACNEKETEVLKQPEIK